MPSEKLMPSPRKGSAKTLGVDLIYARFEPAFLLECLEYLVDPETKEVGLSLGKFADLCGLSPRTIYNYLHEDAKGEFRKPEFEALKKMGKFMKVHFVADWSEKVDNEDYLALLKAQHDRRRFGP